MWWNDFWHAELAESYESQCDVILSDRLQRVLREYSSSGRVLRILRFLREYSSSGGLQCIQREANLSSAFGLGIF